MSGKPSLETPWDRSGFVMTSEDLDIHEALHALSRLLDAAGLSPETRQSVRRTYELLSSEDGGNA